MKIRFVLLDPVSSPSLLSLDRELVVAGLGLRGGGGVVVVEMRGVSPIAPRRLRGWRRCGGSGRR